ncbi:hypothetical protein LGT39_12510 [Demequina sp. TTPB684]|uniref:hypothetical protein n=1 Tax=unclassified Demequina TaxID=2620311 RepID=UPI001CF44A66|nr:MULTISPECIES: hypothetical protein [unclassified Demequina]MCB2413667.1 hypothetical protein [Demequina sp. TTPB684]UPU87729.1 hypothetical protein LGT36_010765 [Demequina sp. TMPB413]
MSNYAADTSVSSERSRAEIERILTRYGADEFGYATNREGARIQFTAGGRVVRFTMPLPDRNATEFTHSNHTPPRRRTTTQAEAAYEQAVRQRWRALALIVKAKLEAVASGIVTFEQEFLPHILLPGGQTVYEATAAGIEAQYLTGAPTPLLQIGGQ